MEGKKSALITGASSGLGRALATRLAAEGYLCFVTARDRAALSELAQQGMRPMPADLSQPEQVLALVEQLRKNIPEGLDLLVYCAGQASLGAIENLPAQAFTDAYAVQVTALHEIIRSQLSAWRVKKRAKVLVVNSGTAYRGVPDNAAYGSSKAAQLSYVESLAIELSELGVSVTSFSPGLLDTPFRNKARVFGPLRVDLAKGNPISIEKTVDRAMRAIRGNCSHLEYSPRARIIRILNSVAPSFVKYLLTRIYHSQRSSG